MAISACGDGNFRVRRLAFPRAAFETLPAMSKKKPPAKTAGGWMILLAVSSGLLFLASHDGQDVRDVGNIHCAIAIDVGLCLVAIACHEGQDVRHVGNVDNAVTVCITITTCADCVTRSNNELVLVGDSVAAEGLCATGSDVEATARTTHTIKMPANYIHGTMSTTLKAAHIHMTIQTMMDASALTPCTSLSHSMTTPLTM